MPEPEVRTVGAPSGTSLLGPIKHLTAVEMFSFLEEPIPNMLRTFRPARDGTVDGLLTIYRATIEQADQVIEAWTDLTQPAPRPPGRGALPPSKRSVLAHMIEGSDGTQDT